MALEDAVNPMQGVSGPGKFAKRTDLQYQPTEYGAGVDMTAQMQGAPLATAPATPHATPTQVRQAAAKVAPAVSQGISLYAPSQRPEEPITTGIPMGDGAGPEVLGINNNLDTQEDRVRMISYLPALEVVAASPTSSQAFRNYVRQLRANLL